MPPSSVQISLRIEEIPSLQNDSEFQVREGSGSDNNDGCINLIAYIFYRRVSLASLCAFASQRQGQVAPQPGSLDRFDDSWDDMPPLADPEIQHMEFVLNATPSVDSTLWHGGQGTVFRLDSSSVGSRRKLR